MKVEITGASNFVNRMFEACGSFQWAREFLKNSIEADANRVEFGIEWEAVRTLGVYRRTIVDDGEGMSRQELLRFFSTLGAGGKPIGGVHDNFGVGAKIASLPWNPNGVVVISYRSGVGSMIWIQLDEESGEYELVDVEINGNLHTVIEPQELDDGVDWDRVTPAWAREHGTTIVLLGSDDAPHTVLGNPHSGESDIKGLSTYLNSRFWDIGHTRVTVAELRSADPAAWPTGPDERDDAKRANNRSIEGARHFAVDVKGKSGRLASSGSVPLAEGRIVAEWYLWEGERPHVHSYAQRGGYVAVRYHGELFHLTSHKAHFRWFGIVETKVRQNLTIVLEPQHYVATNGRWGVHPDQSRNRLIFSGDGDKGTELPLSDWGLEFAEAMPEAIREAIRVARGDGEGSIDDAEYRKRLQNRFGDRWKVRTFVKPRNPADGNTPMGERDGEAELAEDGGPHEDRETKRRRRGRVRKAVRSTAGSGAGELGAARERPVDIPKYRFSHKDNFECDWHLALFAPADPGGPTVFINVDSPILEEVIEYHQAQYPDVFAEDVADAIRAVFGEVAVSKVAHAQQLTNRIAAEELDQSYRTERALTIALMGLLAEESLIARRLASVGRRKPDAA